MVIQVVKISSKIGSKEMYTHIQRPGVGGGANAPAHDAGARARREGFRNRAIGAPGLLLD